MPCKLNPQRRRRLKALKEAERASATTWSDERTSCTSVLDGSPSRSCELGTLEASEASSRTSGDASIESCDTDFPAKEGAIDGSPLQTMEADDLLLQRIRCLEEENERLKATKTTIAYRLIETQDALDRCKEQHDVLRSERDEARSWANAWREEAKDQEAKATAAQEDAQRLYQDALQAHNSACAMEHELWGARNHNNALAYYLGQGRMLNANLQTALYQRDQLIAFGQGMVKGMVQSQHALQSEAIALHQECTTLTEENTLLRIIAGVPPECCPSSEIITASTVQCPAGVQPQLPIGSSLQPAPSPLSCVEDVAASVRQPRPHRAETTASDPCAALKSMLLVDDCTCGHTPSPKENRWRPAESTAEQVLPEWLKQLQHFMAQPLQDDVAQRAEQKLAQPDVAAKKTRSGGMHCRTLDAQFGLGQHRAPLVI